MKKQIPTKAVHWENGMLMVFDKNGDQVPEYQGRVEEKLPLLKKDYPNIEFFNWPYFATMTNKGWEKINEQGCL